jgi:hypothetical protein
VDNDTYRQLDWSPTVWVFLQLGVVLFTVAVIGLFVWMVHRAGQATMPVQLPAPAPEPALEQASGPGRPIAVGTPAGDQAARLAGVESELVGL